MGHGAKDRFQIMPNEVISAQEIKTSIDMFQSGYTDDESDGELPAHWRLVVLPESAHALYGPAGEDIFFNARLSYDEYDLECPPEDPPEPEIIEAT